MPNEKNKYNQNFAGEYCTCHRPYPDPSDPIPDEMIQCIVSYFFLHIYLIYQSIYFQLCEDWYHGRHLNTKLPEMDAFSEMICGLCMEKHSFLANYTGLSHFKPSLDESVNGNDSILNVTSTEESITEQPKEDTDQPPEKRIKLDDCNEDNNLCKKPPIKIESYQGGATFWPEKWRLHLCKCHECLKLYKDHHVDFLPDPEDTVHFYEGKIYFYFNLI